jgi:hypothetical protein
MSQNSALRIPDRFDPSSLARELCLRIAGTSADGSIPGESASRAVIWVDAGSEVVAHLESVQTRLLNRALLVSIDLETDQTGRSPLITQDLLQKMHGRGRQHRVHPASTILDGKLRLGCLGDEFRERAGGFLSLRYVLDARQNRLHIPSYRITHSRLSL